jgi:hypothetical protein
MNLIFSPRVCDFEIDEKVLPFPVVHRKVSRYPCITSTYVCIMLAS